MVVVDGPVTDVVVLVCAEEVVVTGCAGVTGQGALAVAWGGATIATAPNVSRPSVTTTAAAPAARLPRTRARTATATAAAKRANATIASGRPVLVTGPPPASMPQGANAFIAGSSSRPRYESEMDVNGAESGETKFLWVKSAPDRVD